MIRQRLEHARNAILTAAGGRSAFTEDAAAILGQGHCRTPAGMNLEEPPPSFDRLVVEDHIRLWEESPKAIRDAEFVGHDTSIVAAAGTPAIEFRTGFVKRSDMLGNAAHRDSFRSGGTDQRVVDVDVYDEWLRIHRRILSGAFRLRDSLLRIDAVAISA